MARYPVLTMMVAHQADPAVRPSAEVPLDVFIQDIRGDAYLVLRAGKFSVFLTECEAVALVAAIEKLSILATALCSARDYVGKVPPADDAQEPDEDGR